MLDSYHDAYRHFPTATLTASAPATEHQLSWMVAALPFLESSPLYSRFDCGAAWDAEPNRAAVQTDVPVYLCPVHTDWNGPDVRGYTTYVGIAGVGADAADLDKEHPRAGFFGYRRQIARRDLVDGPAYTMAVIETMADNGPWAAGSWPTLRWVDADTSLFIGAGEPFGVRHKSDTVFRTNPVVANAAFVDGSVRTVPADVDAVVFRAMVTIAGREQTNIDF